MKPVDEFNQFILPDKKQKELENSFENNNTPIKNQPNEISKIKSFSNILESCYRKQWIAVSAYYIAEHRGFAPGHALDDWLEAEKLYNEMLLNRFFELAKEDGEITVSGLKQLAIAVGVKNTDKLYSKSELICAIQTVCKDAPCFKTHPPGKCIMRPDCMWESECQKLIAQWQR